MQQELSPTLEVLPFDDHYAIRASVLVDPQSHRNYVYRSFLVFVLEIRSAMDQTCISAIKNAILELCVELLERDGIDHIGFVINAKYHTIRNPNYEGIKDLLTANLFVDDGSDIRQTMQCLRHSLMNEAKKIQGCQMSLFWFSSNVAENPLSPTKESYRIKLNQHLPNYFEEIRKLGATVRQYCVDSRFYTICFANTEGITNKETSFWYDEYESRSSSYFDVSLIYSVANCVNSQKTFTFCTSFSSLRQSFEEVSALMLYDFHELSIMIPIDPDYNNEILGFKTTTYQQDTKMEERHEGERDEGREGEELDIEMVQDYVERETKISYNKLRVVNINEREFRSSGYYFLSKRKLSLVGLKEGGYHLVKSMEKEKPREFPQKKKMILYTETHFKSMFNSKSVDYHEPSDQELIECRVEHYKEELRVVMRRVRDDIVSYKRKYEGNREYSYHMVVNEDLQFKLRERVDFIEERAREVFESVFKSEQIRSENQKRRMYELYSSLKQMIDVAQETIMKTLKKQISNNQIGELSKAISLDKIKSSLRRKLVKRINSNPKLIDNIYDEVEDLCKQINTVDLEAAYKVEKSEVGNCMYSSRNFATALKENDCIAIVLEIERPDSAIADPGRIMVRQVSTMVVSVAKFFEVHLYNIPTSFNDAFSRTNQGKKIFCPICWGECVFLNLFKQEEKPAEQFFGVDPAMYQEKWDYWDRVGRRKTFFGVMPLYVCEENWKVAKRLMKPCLGWTACGEPLGYTFSQYETIPFMALTSLIRSAQEVRFRIEELQGEAFRAHKDADHFQFRRQVNEQKHILGRYENLIKHTQQTCKAILRDLSKPHIEQPLDLKINQKYNNYAKPINRTVDVINNNSSFLGQIYTAIRAEKMVKPQENEFHEFFKRLVEEELRRVNDSWSEDFREGRDLQNEQETEDKYVNKLLNAHIEQMDKPQYVVLNSRFRDEFEAALKGANVLRTNFEIERSNLAMMLKENDKFNETQRMLLIEYKRLYENKVIWMWYVRFRLYAPRERIYIHKWKCLDLTNSYKLFTLIIQNKKQRRNWKRREAIMQDQYADPFNFEEARQFLDQEFIKIRNKKESQNIVMLNTEKYTRAAEVFARSPDLDEAAGTLLNIEVGKEIGFYYKEVKKGPRLMEQKLKMLLRGEHKGVQLFKHGWMMSRKKMNRLRQDYPLVFQRYQYMF